MAKAEKCRLVRMEVENFMKCKLVRIRFGDEPVTEIRGENASGKSSVLRAFWALVGGKDELPEKPLRDGAKSGQILGELDNGLIIRRRFTASGNTYLDVQTKEGDEHKSPQKILDELVGRISFDPLGFMDLEGKDQVAALRKIAGVDFTLLDAKRKQSFEARTEVNRRLAATKARLAAMPQVDAPDAPVSSADLVAEQQRRSEQHAANESKHRDLEQLREEARRATETVKALTAQVANLEKELAETREDLARETKRREEIGACGQALRAEVEALVEPDMEEVPRRVRELDAVNERVRKKKERAALAAELAQVDAESSKLTAEIEAFDAQKAQALAGAAFPVPGLGFGEDGITYGGQPFDQASQAEQIRVSMAMGLALNPKLPVVCIRNGSLLDEASRALVRKMAVEAGAQVLLEIVGKGDSGIVIEDGEVEGAPREPGCDDA